MTTFTISSHQISGNKKYIFQITFKQQENGNFRKNSEQKRCKGD